MFNSSDDYELFAQDRAEVAERQIDATIEVTPDRPLPVEYIPNVWSTIQSGAYAIILVVVVIWLRYGGKVIDYLDNQKEIQATLLELHKDNQSNKRTTDERLTRLESNIEKMLMYLTQDFRTFGSHARSQSLERTDKRVDVSELEQMRQDNKEV